MIWQEQIGNSIVQDAHIMQTMININEEELFGHAGSDWQPAHLLTDAEKAEDERTEAAKKKAKSK